ncbi:MAG: hypothetical protein ACOCRX_01190 [Candidatus Woesearchaeota archaeon]
MDEDKLRKDLKKEIGKRFSKTEEEIEKSREEIRREEKRRIKRQKELERKKSLHNQRKNRTLIDWLMLPFHEAAVIISSFFDVNKKVFLKLLSPFIRIYEKGAPFLVIIALLFFLLTAGYRRASDIAQERGTSLGKFIISLPVTIPKETFNLVVDTTINGVDYIQKLIENRIHYAIHGEYISDVESPDVNQRAGLFLEIFDHQSSLFFNCRENVIRGSAEIKTIADRGFDSKFYCKIGNSYDNCQIDPESRHLDDGVTTPLRATFNIRNESGDYDFSIFSEFNFSSHATLEVYFIDEEYYLSNRDSQGRISSVPNDVRSQTSDSPLTIGLGIGTHPVILYEDQESYRYPIGITINNNWGGDLKILRTIDLNTPEWVTDLKCDLVPDNYISGDSGKFHLDVSASPFLDPVYQDRRDFVTFNCEFEIDHSLFDEDLIMDYFIVTSNYVYEIEKKTTLNIRDNPNDSECGTFGLDDPSSETDEAGITQNNSDEESNLESENISSN